MGAPCIPSEASKLKRQAYSKIYYQKNQERLRVKAKKIYDKDPERLRKIAYDKYHNVPSYKQNKIDYYQRKKQEVVDMKLKIIDLESNKKIDLE